MNFCVCRNCHSCGYRGYLSSEAYCMDDPDEREISKIKPKECPKGKKNIDEFGNDDTN